MAWVAVDKNKREFIYNTKPRRYGNYCWHIDYDEDSESLSGVVSQKSRQGCHEVFSLVGGIASLANIFF